MFKDQEPFNLEYADISLIPIEFCLKTGHALLEAIDDPDNISLMGRFKAAYRYRRTFPHLGESGLTQGWKNRGLDFAISEVLRSVPLPQIGKLSDIMLVFLDPQDPDEPADTITELPIDDFKSDLIKSAIEVINRQLISIGMLYVIIQHSYEFDAEKVNVAVLKKLIEKGFKNYADHAYRDTLTRPEELREALDTNSYD